MPIPHIPFRVSIASDSGLEIIDLEALAARAPTLEHNPANPHRVTFHQLICIEQGAGTHFIDFEHYAYGPGSFIFIAKNQIQAFDFSSHVKGKIILYTDDFIHKIQESMRFPVFSVSFLEASHSAVLSPDKTLLDSSKFLLSEIEREIHRDEKSMTISMLLFASMLLMLTRARPVLYQSRLTQNQSLRLSKFIHMLESGIVSSRDASEYASRLHITYKTLNQLCKFATKQTAKQLIDTYTILEAKRKLTVEYVQIQQLAYDLGFEEPTNFVKYFKKHVLVTPSQFKQKYKG